MVEISSQYRLVTAKDTPGVLEMSDNVMRQAYPKFLMHDTPTSDDKSWLTLHEVFPEFQYALVESATQRAIAQGNCIPLAWEGNFEELPDEGCDWALAQGLADWERGRKPTVLCVISLAVLPEYRGRHLSQYALKYMKEVARTHQFGFLILAARPTLKHLYALTPIERYITWHNESGLPFDPWLRINIRQGAHPLRICSRSTTIIDTVATWESMVDMCFPETGDYIIPGGLVPLKIDYSTDRGVYIEPNIWLCYELS